MESNYDYLIKILTIGESGVGKTCLISRYNKNEFSATHLSTIAIDFKMKNAEINGHRVKIQIWDTAGQERFATLTNGFFKGSDGIIVVYSVTDEKSFENVNKWMQQIQQRAPADVKVLLAGNKTDLEEERKVSYEEGERLAQKYNIPFFETSAKNGTHVNEVFEKLGADVIEKFGGKRAETMGSLSEKDTSLTGGNKNAKKGCC